MSINPGTIRVSPILRSGNNYSIHLVFNTLDEARVYKGAIIRFLEEYMDAIPIERTGVYDKE